ncbi:MAG: hypothetical protein Q8R02_06350 [Hyphomonadaceae bacterium]|nr:hypothetical protein [Hyphomonadaceae bacterium]
MRIRVACLTLIIMILPAAAAQEFKMPRTPAGAPDLQGVWTNTTATLLERPGAFDAPTTTEGRATAFIAASKKAFLEDNSDGIGGRQSEWWEIGDYMTKINGEIRTSVIVDPPNGKLPYSEAGKAMLAKAQSDMFNVYDHPEARPSPERCLSGGSGSTGVPIFTARYNGNYQIVQTADHLVISMEQNGVVRIIPLGGAGGTAAGARRWMGNSIARWEGDTLVVRTDGFHPGDAYKPAAAIYVSENARVTERFTRISPTEILYQYTVEDPDAFSQTWRGEQLFYTTTNRVLESACHEGNYSLPGILAGGREFDRRKAKANK